MVSSGKRTLEPELIRQLQERVDELGQWQRDMVKAYGEKNHIKMDLLAWKVAKPMQPCGHPVSAIKGSDEGTNMCGECLREQTEKEAPARMIERIKDLENALRKSTALLRLTYVQMDRVDVAVGLSLINQARDAVANAERLLETEEAK